MGFLGLGACDSDEGSRASGATDNADNPVQMGDDPQSDDDVVDNPPVGDPGAGYSEVCTDRDGDGYGPGCVAGGDCNDQDANVFGPDTCNGEDDDCDGSVDEFVSEVCGICDVGCTSEPTPGPREPWQEPTDENSNAVIVDDGGAITLTRADMESFAIWVANTDDSTVSKLDSRTNVELARYVTVLTSEPGGRPEFQVAGATPSRTAVDQNFDAYVANRAFGQQGTVTKYANSEINCIDRNNNGVIDTSRDLNGDGAIDTDPAVGEYLGQQDECILWTVAVGANNGVPRALAVGLAPPDGLLGNVYVGLHGARQVCRLDPGNGATQACVDTPNFRPYGAAADGRGNVWLVSRDDDQGLAFVDSSDQFTQIPDEPPCNAGQPQPYGVSVDASNRAYFVTSNCAADSIYRYDHYNGQTWEQATIPTGGTQRGIAVDRDSLWVAISGNGQNDWGGGSDRIERFALESLAYQGAYRLPTGRSQVGVGVSFDGSVWAISQGTNSASRLDPTLPEGDPGRWIERSVGTTPYTYSDFIGFGLNTFVDPRGFYRFVLEGCGAAMETVWSGVRHVSDLPAGTRVVVNVRSADSRAELAAAPWVGPFSDNPARLSEAPGPVPQGDFLEVELVLSTANQEEAPRVFGVEVAKECRVAIQ